MARRWSDHFLGFCDATVTNSQSLSEIVWSYWNSSLVRLTKVRCWPTPAVW